MRIKKPFLIAEISANHCGSYSMAKKLIKSAKINGADAVKLQTYTADTMTIKSNKRYFKIKNGIWRGYQLWDLYNEAHTPWSWHKKLFKYANNLGIKIFSTPFDETAVDFLESINCPMYKVSSFEMTDLPLIKKIAKTKKPIIISTGTSSIKEITEAYNVAKKFGSKKIILLYCISNYPSLPEHFDLNNIKLLKQKFKCTVGLSDHSINNKVAITAVAMGAEVFEKHIALEKQKKGHDLEFSLKGNKLREFREDINLAYNLIKKKSIIRKDVKSKIFRRSIFASKNIKKGEVFTKYNIKKIRPGHGLSPKFYEILIGKRSKNNIEMGEPITKKNYV
jgi:pseudaminic acid synthase